MGYGDSNLRQPGDHAPSADGPSAVAGTFTARRTRVSRNLRTALLFQVPMLVVLVSITIVPLIYGANLSLRSYSMVLPDMTGQWVGLANFQRMLHDGDFWHSLALTAIYVGVGVSIQLVAGLAMALLLHALDAGRGIVLTLLMLPMVVAPLVVGLMFSFLCNAQFGLLTWLIQITHLPLPQGLLGDPSTALPVLILTDIWEWTPFMILMLLAGLQSMPTEPFEAARCDGAGSWDTLRYLTLPLLKPFIMVAVLFRSVDALKEFDKVYILTGGGPGTATDLIDLFTYRTAFLNWDMSYGAALGMVLFVISMIAASIFLFVLRRQERESAKS